MPEPIVSLRPVTAEDIPLFERMAADPDVGGAMNWSGFTDAGDARRRFEANGFLERDRGRLMVVSDGQTVGHVGWHAVDNGPGGVSRCWNMGIALVPEWRGKGLGAPAQRALAAYLFDVTPAVRVEATTRGDNLAEQRALTKAGFTREGTLRQAQFSQGAWRDLIVFSLLRGE